MLNTHHIVVLLSLVLSLLINACASLSTATPATSTAKQSSGDAASWFQLGKRYAEQAHYEQAEHAYRQALTFGPHSKALHNLGLVQLRLGIQALREVYPQLAPHNRAQTRAFVDLLLRSAL